MRVLLVHSFLYPEHGGDSVYTHRLGRLLAEHGHEVALWGMRDEKNPAHALSQFEVAPIDFAVLNGRKSLANGLRVLSRAVYSNSARRRLAALLDHWTPDVVHLQSIHYHLTTSILRELHARKLPVVWTQHNLSLVCCSTMMSAGSICERCKPNRFYSPLLTRCKKGSFAASAVGALQLSFDHYSGVYGTVDHFVTVSRFHKRKLVEFGFDEEAISVVPAFHDGAEGGAEIARAPGQPYILYFGRLSPEKGVHVLIRAMRHVRSDVPLFVVGDGPQREELESLAVLSRVGVRFLGLKHGDELSRLIRGSLFCVTPSICYENFPNTVVEAFARARPVVASAIGGIPEIVLDGQTGLLHEPGRERELALAIERLLDRPDLRHVLGQGARDHALAELDPELHYRRLVAIYSRYAGGSYTEPQSPDLQLEQHVRPEPSVAGESGRGA